MTSTDADTDTAAPDSQTRAQATPSRNTDRRLWLLGLAVLAGLGLLIALYVGGAAYETPAAGIPDPGAFVGWGLPLSKLVAVVTGTLTLGFLVSAAFLMPAPSKHVVSRAGRRDLLAASGTAAVWALASVAMILFTHASVVGRPLREALAPDLFWSFAFAVPSNVAYLVVAVLAACVSGAALLSSRTGAAAMLTAVAGVALILPPLNAHGGGSGDHALALTADAVHALAAALWVGGLIAVIRHAFAGDKGVDVALLRFSRLALVAIVALAISGLASSYVRLERFSDLWETAYGVLVLFKVVLLVGLFALAARIRRRLAVGVAQRRGRDLLGWLVTETTLMFVAMGVGASLTLTAYPRVDIALGSPGEELLGFPFPPAPTPASVAFGWYPDAFWLLVCLTLALGYGWAVLRLRRRGVSWNWGRTISWYLAVLALFWVTNAGIAAYGQVSLGWHMVQHMILAMLVPILLVLGMPTTLALRALRPAPGTDRGPREWLLWGLHSPVSRVVTHPGYVLFIGTIGLFGLYFTPLFATAMTSHVGHVLMMVHFLLSGFLFYWVVMGLDPGPRSVPPMFRLLLLLVYMAFHAWFAIAITASTEPLAADWYGQVQPPWLPDLLADTSVSGGVAWGFGEIPTLIVIIVVAVQWSRSDDREARRMDRQADRDGDAELEAYNAYLARLSRRDTASASSRGTETTSQQTAPVQPSSAPRTDAEAQGT
ncbi:MAG: bifunctional copper resistance protein CopD/cytochrome c oxidase assembly protein [Actinobacteria bacterium]|nr:bifunctional copper resistance protein CopD/cytochrome c oxidase assembly protein [Actinomycetota bacterium]